MADPETPDDALPQPGRPARGTSTGRPVMVLLDLLGRRWTLRILWELRADALSFRALQGACGGLSPSVLNQRMRELTHALLVARTADGYALTQRGQSLLELLAPVNAWAEEWAQQLRPGRTRARDDNPSQG